MNETTKIAIEEDVPATEISKEVLDAASMATLLREPSTDEARSLVEELYRLTDAFERTRGTKRRARRTTDLEKFKKAIGAFASDLLFHSLNTEALGFCYHSSRRDGFSRTLMTTTYFDSLVKAWSELGLIDVTGAFNVKAEFDGEYIHTRTGEVKNDLSRARRARATPYMLEIAAHHGVKAESVGQHFSKFRKESELVLVRAAGKDKTNLKDPNGDARKREDSRKKLREINEFLAQHSFNLGYSPELRRIFNNGDLVDFDYNAGGRLYCRDGRNWQTMNKETERPLITIDGEPTAEVDVHASQLSILYALCGDHLDPMSDAYALPEFDRDAVKGAVTIALGQGKLPRQWPKKFSEEYTKRPDKTLPGIRKVVDAIVEAHPPMRRLGSEGLGWARLQYEESEAILEAVLRLQRSFGIPSLPIHDSLIVRAGDSITAAKTLLDVYRERFGISITVRTV